MPLSGASITHLAGGLYEAGAEETLTIPNSVVSLSVDKYTKEGKVAKRAFMTIETATFRYFYSGTNPSASVGHIARNNSIVVIVGSANIKNFRAIRKDSTNSKATITYEF